MVADEESDEYKETAIGYAVGVLTYMQNGGKLSSIEATASEIVRLAGQEVGRGAPGPMKARVLMESVEEMRLRHNSLNADAVFEDMMAQARIAGRLREPEREKMQSFRDIASDVVTAYENGTYKPGANPAADHVVEAIRTHTKWIVLAAAAVIESKPDEFDDIPADRIGEFLDDRYLGFGATVADALREYAEDDMTSGRMGELGRLYEALDKAGGVDRFDWGSYADDGMTPTIGLHFIVMPVPAGEPSTYVFGS